MGTRTPKAQINLYIAVWSGPSLLQNHIPYNISTYSKDPCQNEYLRWFLIELGFNDTSTLVGHFVSSFREREKRDRRDSREVERKRQGSRENDWQSSNSEITEEMKTFSFYPYLLQGKQALPNCTSISVGRPDDVKYTRPLPHPSTPGWSDMCPKVLFLMAFLRHQISAYLTQFILTKIRNATFLICKERLD